MTIKIILSALILSTMMVVNAQSNLFTFKQIDYRDGLPNNGIYYIIQDKKGFMWLGTSKGLCRYDGKKIKRFTHQLGKKQSLTGNDVKNLLEASNGKIWIATLDNGVSCYDPTKPDSIAFTNYTHQPNNPNSISGNEIYCLNEDNQGRIWLGIHDRSLCCIDPKNGKIENISIGANETVFQIFKDIDGQFWCGLRNQGFCLLNSTTKKVKIYDLKNNTTANTCGGFTNDLHDPNILWVTYSNIGLIKFDKKQEKVIETFPMHEDFIIEPTWDNNGLLWIGTRHGLLVFNPTTKLFQSLDKADLFTDGVSGNETPTAINDLYADKMGNIWIATASKGLLQYNASQNDFLTQKAISFETSKTATVGQSGYYLYSQKQQQFAYFDKQLDKITAYTKNTIPSGINAIYYHNNQLYISSNASGVYTWKKGELIKKLPIRDEIMRNIMQKADINSIIADTINGEPILWIGSWSNGLFRYSLNSLSLQCYDKAIFPSEKIINVSKTNDGRIWLGTDGYGLILLTDKEKIQYYNFKNNTENIHTIHNNITTNVYRDKQGNTWAGSGISGIAKWNGTLQNDSWTVYIPNDETDYQFVFINGEDARGCLWLSTQSGISIFNPHNNSFDNRKLGDGLIPKTGYNDFFFHEDGIITFASKNAFISGDTRKLDGKKTLAAPVISRFSVFENDRFDYLTGDKIHLKYNENYFSVDYVSLSYTPNNNDLEFAYRLIGLNEEWTNVGNRQSVSYTNLNGGDYTFEVKVRKSGAAWSAPTRLPIFIDPPFWATWWFRLMASLLIMALIYAFYRYQIQKATLESKIQQEQAAFREKEAAFQQKLVETEMSVLRAQMNPHFLFNVLNSINYFTLQNDAHKASIYLTKFSKLIRQVLENARSEKVLLDNELKALELYIELERMRFSDKFNYQFNIDDDIDTESIQIPPLLLQPYIENAIWHGLMHKEDKGNLSINIALNNDFDKLIISIEDDGVGRAKAAEYKSKMANKHKSFGTEVTAERIKAINALYKVNTQVNIIDLIDSYGNAAGTKVVLAIFI